ncbi:hypothetical protein D9Q98_005232 [Chlorella vulgaris]|uniref:N-acetyltransferase domain-containing protein n=1 Tax=Chlorella vulgaris TaxID=3077 RepID=A0A9D4TQ18_CHLVU|nr:hypothetical protein D9Q98_005232 [Chlorella vulgaris]
MVCRSQPQPAAAAASRAAARPTTPATHTQHPASSSRAAREPRWTRCRATDFHQSLLAATERDPSIAASPLGVEIREALSDDELRAICFLRALSFYRYPEDRKFAAHVHRTMIAEQEFEALKLDALNRTLGKLPDCQRSSSLLAVCSADEFAGRIGDNRGELEPELVIPGSAESSSSSSSSMGSRTADGLQAAPQLAVVGTLDLYAVRALPGEVLIGNSQNPAYLANVCTASAARRRGVGQVLLEAGRRLAIEWEVDAMYVHTMAVNEIAVNFYLRNGFVIEKEETSNQAHYRGACLDGIEGRGRTVLLRDTLLHA